MDAKAPNDLSSRHAPEEGITGTHALRVLFAEKPASPNPVFNTWFFIEHLDISDISANVTVTLSSRITALLSFETEKGRPPDDADVDDLEPDMRTHNQLMHVFQRSGFQLMNVNNVALQLKVRRCIQAWYMQAMLGGRCHNQEGMGAMQVFRQP
jgi:hypothetical protein